ncbi:MAG TPA: stage II sporulation protein D, partial [Bacillus bacterium]|nr:stage II sporulation protein D [Bacillus sp. (in: firmicutes)]
MLKFKPFIVLAAILFAVTLIIPSILVLPFMEDKAGGKLGEDLQNESKDVSAVPSADASVEVAV